MADTKTTDLGAIPALAGADVLPIVDATDTTTKKVTVTQLDARYDAAGSADAAEAAAIAASQPLAAVLTATTASFTTADESKLDGIEAGADVTDTTNVTAAGALMDSEVDADIKTLSLPPNTTISTYGASLVDDADAATARTTLGAVGSTDVTDIVVLTQAAYDLLTPATETLYLIVG